MKRSATNNLELETAALNGNVRRVRSLLGSVDSQTVFKVMNNLEYIIWMGEDGPEEDILKCLELMIPKLDVNVTYNDKSLANEMLGLLNTYNQNEDYGLQEPIERIIKSIITDPKFVNTDTVIEASRLYLTTIIPLFNKEQINQTFEGRTPLKEAIERNFTTMVEILIDNGADVNAKVEGKTPLDYAFVYQYDIIKLLIKNGATETASERIKPIIDSFTPRFEQQRCAICLNNFDESAIRLPCGHGFHKECIVKWFQINNECPKCRMKIDKSFVDAFAALTLVRDNTWKLRF